MKPGAAAALRKKAAAALRLERQGLHREAIASVEDLAARHKESALVLHLAGYLHRAAAQRAINAGDRQAIEVHIVSAQNYLAEAKRLVPNCIAISDLLASALYLGLKPVEAEKEAREAVSIDCPVDPADNSVLYPLGGSSTRDQRVEDCRRSARANLSLYERKIPSRVREVLELHADGDEDGAREALAMAKSLAELYPTSSRAQLLSYHMQLQCVRLLGPDMDRRLSLDAIRQGIEETITSSFGGSLVFALFHAKLCFVLGLYETFYFECIRAFSIPELVDPKLEDVPPHSVPGDEIQDRIHSIDNELGCLLNKLSLVAYDFRCSMASEDLDGFLSVRLVELQEYYDTNFGNYEWSGHTTIADALRFVKNNMSWRFWVCPSCAGNEFADINSLLEHMKSKHLPNLRSVFGPGRIECVILDGYLDQISVYQDSEGHHFLRFNKADYVFEHLSLPTKELSFTGLKEKQRTRGKKILNGIRDKLKLLPADKSSAEFDESRLEVQDMWLHFVKSTVLDYRIVIMTFAKPFIWTKLLQSLSEDRAAREISNDDIDVIFPRGFHYCSSEVHAEDKMGRLEIQPNSNIANVQSGVNSASNLLGSSSQSSEKTTSISIYRKSFEALDKDTNGIFILNFIIQMLWNLRCFRDEFLKRRPVCTLPSHEGSCISQMLYGIFTAWETDDHHITDSLISIRDTICQVLDDNTVVQNVEVNTSSYIVTNILNGLKMPEVFLEIHLFNFPCDTKVFETLGQAAIPEKELCNKEIICGEVGIKESTTCGGTLDMDSLQIAEAKSFTDDKCRQVDQLPVSLPEFSTLAVHIVLSEENKRNLLDDIRSNPDMVFFRFRNATPDTIKCTFVSMISVGVTQQIYQFGVLLFLESCWDNTVYTRKVLS